MCGIVGFWDKRQEGREENVSQLQGMCNTLITRGPDDAGYWHGENDAIYLGHRRLSVIDLSSAGHQPMKSANGQYTIVFNGEIYNHRTLREELEQNFKNIKWKGASDTETLLVGFEYWGVRATIEKTVGMFAIALWDNSEKCLYLIRDRAGEKPLYYGRCGNSFVFASELKAFKKYREFKAEIDRNVLSLYTRFNYVPAPYTIYKSVYKLPPSTILKLKSPIDEPEIKEYWSVLEVAQNGIHNCTTETFEEASEHLEQLLHNSIQGQMLSDVPLGAFLSGGIDSSLIVALMQKHSKQAVKTFTIGSYEKNYDESIFAKEVARHLKTDHTEFHVTDKDARDVIPLLPQIYDEPFADSSQIPTYLVSKLAKQKVTVALSGDAGDEIFCGYNRYLFVSRLWGKMSLMPLPTRKIFAHCIELISPSMWNQFGKMFQWSLPRSLRSVNIGDKLHKGAGIIENKTVEELYSSVVSTWKADGQLVINGKEPESLLSSLSSKKMPNNIEKMMLLDFLTYLTDDIFVKVDRASMAVSLETRAPFLDHRIVEYAWHLPLDYKLNKGVTKRILRHILYKYVPKNLIERPKMGFGVPIDSWLRGPLKPWAEGLISHERLQQEGFFHSHQIQKKWQEHLSGKRNWQYHLWNILMFQAWYESITN